MAIIQSIPTSCKADLLKGGHDFSTDQFKMALYGANASIGPNTTVYVSDNEVVGTGYTAGGVVLTGQQVMTSSGSAWVAWTDPVWPAAGFFAAGAMVYNVTKGNKAVLILNFGMARPFTPTSNTVKLPQSTAETALMRLT